jgi:putative peptidoglycan lipid II flippase
MRLVGIVTVPSSIAFLFFGPLMTETLFFGISLNDSNYLGYTLCALALGLAPMSINLIALRGLNAFENVKLQVLSNAIMNIVGIIVSIVVAFTLPAEWVTVGLAGALAFSYFFGAWSTIRLLRRYEISISISEVVGFYLKLTALALLVAVPVWFSRNLIPGGNMIRLIIVLVVCGVGYLALCKIARVSEITSAIQVLTRRKR